MKSSRLLLPLFLLLALLFAQQGAATHGISHVLAEQSHDQSLPHDKQCDLCAAYAQIGSAVGCDGIHFDFASHAEETLAVHSVALLPSTFAAFAARAPPYSA
ncbi:MAG: hypothetical protein HZB47_02640 [Nitrosomonadales bacterium]|nr:hypothetical protein [Nitrosomonadales bacterium]